jgi:uncharacterized protein (TIGR02217 family)
VIDIRLARDIEVGAKAKPRYSTDIIPTDGGHEVRNARWRYPLFDFEFTLEPGDETDEGDTDPALISKLEEFVRLFHVVGGCHTTFPLRHWRDYDAVDQVIATGDGSTQSFQLYRTYALGAVTRRRKILLPVTGSVTAKVNGVTASLAAVNRGTGMITLSAAPAAGAIVTASYQFDVPVRFADDELEMIALGIDLDQPSSIILKEVRSV